MKRAYVWLVGLCLCLGALTGCGSDGSSEDEKKPDSGDEVYPEYVVYSVDGYRVRAFCEGTTRVFIKGDALAAVDNSPECGGAQ